MERGWFHAAMGYWQTTGEVPASVLQSYPDGTIEVPVKPSDSHEWNGSNWVYVAPPPPDPAAMIEAFRRAVDAHVDATAQSKGYNSAAHCASYVASTHAPWAAEAQVFVAWRDQVWLFVFQQLALVEAGTISAPASPDELIATLPQIEW